MIKQIINDINKNYNISLLPYEKFELTTTKNKEEVLSTLAHKMAYVESFGTSINSNSFMDYEGWVKKGEFKFRPILKSGMNSFIPIINGKIYNEGGKVKFTSVISLHKPIIVFVIILTVFGFSMFGMSLYSKYSYQDTHHEITEELKEVREIIGEEKYNEIIPEQNPNLDGFISGSFLFALMPYIISTIFFNLESRKVKADLMDILIE